MQQYKSFAKIILAYKNLSDNTMSVMFIEGNFGYAIQQPEASIFGIPTSTYIWLKIKQKIKN